MNESSSPSHLYPGAPHHDETLSSGYAAPGGGTHRINAQYNPGVDTSQTSYNINYSQAPGSAAGGAFHQGRPSNPFARNQYFNNNNSYLSSYQGGVGTHPSNSTYQAQDHQRPSNRAGVPSKNNAPWTGDYLMNKGPANQESKRDKTLQDLA